MNFESLEGFKKYIKFKEYIKGLKKLGRGREGIAYLTKDKAFVIKVFYDPKYNRDDFLQFKDTFIEGFSFIRDAIIIDDKVVATIASYVPGYDIQTHLLINEPIDQVIIASCEEVTKIDALCKARIVGFDADRAGNIIFNGSSFTIIDTAEFYRLPDKVKDGYGVVQKHNFNIMSEIYASCFYDKNIIKEFLRRNNSIYKDYDKDPDLARSPREVLLGIKGELESYLDMKVTTMAEASRKLSKSR